VTPALGRIAAEELFEEGAAPKEIVEGEEEEKAEDKTAE
jgi:hypothetical protein